MLSLHQHAAIYGLFTFVAPFGAVGLRSNNAYLEERLQQLGQPSLYPASMRLGFMLCLHAVLHGAVCCAMLGKERSRQMEHTHPAHA